MSKLKQVQPNQRRKEEQFRIALSEKAQFGNPGFDNYLFVHNALPELDFGKIDTTTTFLGKKVNYPFFISCMTGGVKEGERINRNLAKAAQKYKIPLGLGSARIAFEQPKLAKQFYVRDIAPEIPLMANIGLVELNYGFGLAEFQKIVDMTQADALAIHFNPLQEVIQPEGERSWENLLSKLEKIVKRLSVPLIAKEVGFGLSGEVTKKLYGAGIRIFDTAGWGGTNWALVEGSRGKVNRHLGELFANWGIPTTESIKACVRVRRTVREKITIIGSGGIRSGLDIAKVLALGADMAGIATPFAKAAIRSQKEVETMIEQLGQELKIAMFGVGAKNIAQLKKASIIPQNGY